jgi:hypothetical protein
MTNIFDKMFNITNLNNETTSLAKALLFFYVLMAITQNDLLGKQMKEFINDRLVQHVIAFIMMVAIVNLIGGIQETDKLLFYSVIAYVWFVLSTKLDIQWNLILILLLFVWFLYDNRLQNRQAMMIKDNSVDKEIRRNIMNEYQSLNTYVVSGLIIVTLIGVYLYGSRKTVQYGGGKYNPIKFLLY